MYPIFRQTHFCVETLHNSPHLCGPPCEGKVICARVKRCALLLPSICWKRWLLWSIGHVMLVAIYVIVNKGNLITHRLKECRCERLSCDDRDDCCDRKPPTETGDHRVTFHPVCWMVPSQEIEEQLPTAPLFPETSKRTDTHTKGIQRYYLSHEFPGKALKIRRFLKCIAASQWQSFWRRLCRFIQGNGYAL